MVGIEPNPKRFTQTAKTAYSVPGTIPGPSWVLLVIPYCWALLIVTIPRWGNSLEKRQKVV